MSKLSACLIVKNEEKTLALTLPILSVGVDEIILVDTGSTDGTVALAEKHGAKVYHFPWIKDFAAARNESLKHATGDWILWVDADEYIKTEDLAELRRLLETAEADAYTVTMYTSGFGQCERRQNYPRVKVFRNGRGAHFVRPINEQLVDAAGKVLYGPTIPVAIYHWGKDLAAEKIAAKWERNVDLYSQAAAANPADPYYPFLLGHTLTDMDKLAEAIEQYRKVVALTKDETVVRPSREKIAQHLLRLGKFREALDAARELLERDEYNVPAHNIFAAVCLMQKNADKAIEILGEVIGRDCAAAAESPYQCLSLPQVLLGKAYEQKGEQAKADACFRRARELYPYSGGQN